MTLREHMEAVGSWMFRWRSYLPLVAVVLLTPAVLEFSYFMGTPSGDLVWSAVCVLISLSGLALRAYTVGQTPAGTSGRNTHGQVAERLNTSGIYSIVRHPLYLGNFLMWMGIALFLHHLLTALLVAAVFFIYYERIMLAEEAYLKRKFGDSFDAWAARTPAVWPRFRNWRRPELAFSFRNVLRREHSGFYALVVAFTVLELVAESRVRRRLHLEPEWVVFLVVGTAVYVLLVWLKKQTRILHVAGR